MLPSAFLVSQLLSSEEVQLSELDLNRLGLAHAALKKLLENRGLTVLQSDPVRVLWRRSGDGEIVSLEPYFWHQEDYQRSASKKPGLYVFSGTWHARAPSKEFKGEETAEICADPHGSPKVAASDIISQLATATYAGRPVRYRSNR